MFWKKKRVNEASVFGIVALASPFSYRVHDMIVEEDIETKFFHDKGEMLFIHVMAASVILSIIQIDKDYYPLYRSEVIGDLSKHYTKLREACEDFEECLSLDYDESYKLDTITLRWLHKRVGSGDTSNQEEIDMLAGAVQAIFQIFYNWFEKNDMPI